MEKMKLETAIKLGNEAWGHMTPWLTVIKELDRLKEANKQLRMDAQKHRAEMNEL